MSDASEPLSRAERQQQTRAALVNAARAVFARDGFHGASLETIAREAGLTKGAVYSNFDSKADLFLAVMDRDLDHIDDDWDPIAQWAQMCDLEVREALERGAEDPELSWGFGLATLEFAAYAGRHPELLAAAMERLARLAAAYEAAIEPRRSPSDPLRTDQLVSLLTALDQGVGLLAMGGWGQLDGDTIRRAMLRLLRPAEDEDDDPARRG